MANKLQSPSLYGTNDGISYGQSMNSTFSRKLQPKKQKVDKSDLCDHRYFGCLQGDAISKQKVHEIFEGNKIPSYDTFLAAASGLPYGVRCQVLPRAMAKHKNVEGFVNLVGELIFEKDANGPMLNNRFDCLQMGILALPSLKNHAANFVRKIFGAFIHQRCRNLISSTLFPYIAKNKQEFADDEIIRMIEGLPSAMRHLFCTHLVRTRHVSALEKVYEHFKETDPSLSNAILHGCSSEFVAKELSSWTQRYLSGIKLHANAAIERCPFRVSKLFQFHSTALFEIYERHLESFKNRPLAFSLIHSHWFSAFFSGVALRMSDLKKKLTKFVWEKYFELHCNYPCVALRNSSTLLKDIFLFQGIDLALDDGGYQLIPATNDTFTGRQMDGFFVTVCTLVKPTRLWTALQTMTMEIDGFLGVQPRYSSIAATIFATLRDYFQVANSKQIRNNVYGHSSKDSVFRSQVLRFCCDVVASLVTSTTVKITSFSSFSMKAIGMSISARNLESCSAFASGCYRLITSIIPAAHEALSAHTVIELLWEAICSKNSKDYTPGKFSQEMIKLCFEYLCEERNRHDENMYRVAKRIIVDSVQLSFQLNDRLGEDATVDQYGLCLDRIGVSIVPHVLMQDAKFSAWYSQIIIEILDVSFVDNRLLMIPELAQTFCKTIHMLVTSFPSIAILRSIVSFLNSFVLRMLPDENHDGCVLFDEMDYKRYTHYDFVRGRLYNKEPLRKAMPQVLYFTYMFTFRTLHLWSCQHVDDNVQPMQADMWNQFQRWLLGIHESNDKMKSYWKAKLDVIQQDAESRDKSNPYPSIIVFTLAMLRKYLPAETMDSATVSDLVYMILSHDTFVRDTSLSRRLDVVQNSRDMNTFWHPLHRVKENIFPLNLDSSVLSPRYAQRTDWFVVVMDKLHQTFPKHHHVKLLEDHNRALNPNIAKRISQACRLREFDRRNIEIQSIFQESVSNRNVDGVVEVLKYLVKSMRNEKPENRISMFECLQGAFSGSFVELFLYDGTLEHNIAASDCWKAIVNDVAAAVNLDKTSMQTILSLVERIDATIMQRCMRVSKKIDVSQNRHLWFSAAAVGNLVAANYRQGSKAKDAFVLEEPVSRSTISHAVYDVETLEELLNPLPLTLDHREYLLRQQAKLVRDYRYQSTQVDSEYDFHAVDDEEFLKLLRSGYDAIEIPRPYEVDAASLIVSKAALTRLYEVGRAVKPLTWMCHESLRAAISAMENCVKSGQCMPEIVQVICDFCKQNLAEVSMGFEGIRRLFQALFDHGLPTLQRYRESETDNYENGYFENTARSIVTLNLQIRQYEDFPLLAMLEKSGSYRAYYALFCLSKSMMLRSDAYGYALNTLELSDNAMRLDASAIYIREVTSMLRVYRQDILGARYAKVAENPSDKIPGLFFVDREYITAKRTMSPDELSEFKATRVGVRPHANTQRDYKMCIQSSIALSKLVFVDSMNNTQPLFQRISSLKRWLMSLCIDNAQVIEGIDSLLEKATEEVATNGSVNPETQALFSTMIPAAISSSLDPWKIIILFFSAEILSNDVTGCVGIALEHASKTLVDSEMMRLLRHILESDVRPNFFKLGVHKLLINKLFAIASDDSITMMFNEWERKNIHIDVRDHLVTKFIELLTQPATVSRCTMHTIDRILTILASCSKYSPLFAMKVLNTVAESVGDEYCELIQQIYGKRTAGVIMNCGEILQSRDITLQYYRPRCTEVIPLDKAPLLDECKAAASAAPSKIVSGCERAYFDKVVQVMWKQFTENDYTLEKEYPHVGIAISLAVSHWFVFLRIDTGFAASLEKLVERYCGIGSAWSQSLVLQSFRQTSRCQVSLLSLLTLSHGVLCLLEQDQTKDEFSTLLHGMRDKLLHGSLTEVNEVEFAQYRFFVILFMVSQLSDEKKRGSVLHMFTSYTDLNNRLLHFKETFLRPLLLSMYGTIPNLYVEPLVMFAKLVIPNVKADLSSQ